jgi:hypothetical protein
MTRSCLARAARGLLLATVIAAAQATAAPVSESEVKLALTYKLLRFVTWPSQRERSSELAFCVVGKDPFKSSLDGIRGRKVRDRSIVVVNLDASQQIVGRCDLVYVSRDEAGGVESVLARVAGAPILTVSDAPGFAAAGGIVELQNRDDRIGFVINTEAYQKVELLVSSQLLELATLVNGHGGRVP